MFKKYYKDANNDINTNRQLIDNIFESATTKTQKAKRIALYKYGMAIAAVFVLVFTAAFYEDIVRLNDEKLSIVEESVPKMTRSVPESTEKDEQQFSRNIEGEYEMGFSVGIDTFSEISEAKTKEITEVLLQRFGEKDEETGNIYIFEIVGRAETEWGGYYLGRWRWLVGDHSSLLTSFVLNEDMTELYECTLNSETGDVLWIEERNMFE